MATATSQPQAGAMPPTNVNCIITRGTDRRAAVHRSCLSRGAWYCLGLGPGLQVWCHQNEVPGLALRSRKYGQCARETGKIHYSAIGSICQLPPVLPNVSLPRFVPK